MSCTLPVNAGQSALLMVKIAEILETRGVRYAIVGAMAAAFHGVVRASIDADALVSLPEKSGQDEVIQIFRSLGLVVALRDGDPWDPISGLIEIEDRFSNRVDLLLGIRGISNAAFDRALQVELFGTTLRVLGLEDFIASKILAGGVQDIEDIRGVLAVSKEVNPIMVREILGSSDPEQLNLFARLLAEKGDAA